MDVNQKIREALTDLVNDNIWALTCPLEELPDEWITYNPEQEKPELYGDDDDLEWAHYMQVHWFKKTGSTAAADYTGARKEIRKRLKAAGFTVTQIVPLFEPDETQTPRHGGITHLVVYCHILEDDL